MLDAFQPTFHPLSSPCSAISVKMLCQPAYPGALPPVWSELPADSLETRNLLEGKGGPGGATGLAESLLMYFFGHMDNDVPGEWGGSQDSLGRNFMGMIITCL